MAKADGRIGRFEDHSRFPSGLSVTRASEIIREIDASIDAIEALATAAPDSVAYYRDLLRLAGAPIAAVASQVWLAGPDGKLSPRFRAGEELGFLTAGTCSIESSSRAGSQRVQESDRSFLVVGSPIRDGAERTGALAFVVEANVPESAEAGYVNFAETVAELAAEFEARSRWRSVESSRAEMRAFLQLTDEVHGSWQLEEMAYRIANEGRSYLDCDRLSVLRLEGRRSCECRMLAVSGVDRIDRRTQSVMAAEKLAEAVTAGGESIISDGETSRLPPQLEMPLNEYLEISAARSVAVIPLADSGEEAQDARPFGVLIAEQFERSGFQEYRLNRLCRQAALALGNSVRMHRVPLVKTGLALHNVFGITSFSWLGRGLFASLVLIGLAALMMSMPTDFDVTVRGHLQPVERRHVYAPFNGEIAAVHVREGQAIAESEIVLRIESRELELEFKRLSSELATIRQRLVAIDTLKLQGASDGSSQASASELASEQLTLVEQAQSLGEQLEILDEQRSRLDVLSPVAGEVLTPNVVRELSGRPVQTGQPLLVVADLDGDWLIEFSVPDTDVGHIIRARELADEALPVRFVLANEPQQEYVGKTQSIGLTPEPSVDAGPTILVEVQFDAAQGVPMRPGASVVGKIQCGRKSRLFVWFHDIYEELRRRFF